MNTPPANVADGRTLSVPAPALTPAPAPAHGPAASTAPPALARGAARGAVPCAAVACLACHRLVLAIHWSANRCYW